MSEVNFYLKDPKKEGDTPIYLKYLYNGKILKYYIGQSIDKSKWNFNKQRVKNNKLTTEDGKHYVNDLLDNLAKECKLAYNEALKDGIPAPETLREKLNAFINQNDDTEKDKKISLFSLIERFTNNEIKYNGKDKSPNTIMTYNTTYGHLKEFVKKEKEYSGGLDFEDINLDFYYKYLTFLKGKNLGQNAISKDIQILKVFMSEAVDLGYTENLKFRHKKFAVARVDTDSVFLTESELTALYNYDLSQNKKLEAVRDLFIFGCYVGLRFSDYSTIRPENIVNIDGDYFIKQITQKTGELVIIPCNPVVMEIFNKYKNNPNRLPRTISNQKFNEYIKEAMKAVTFIDKDGKEKPVFTETGRLSTEPTLELWETVSSHTARRSFCTNLYLDGFPTIDIMRVSGHRTEKSFMKYIRVSKLDTALRLGKHIKNNWNNKLLKLTA
ncbi:MAG: site-specific integrase [Taibaiella sp.]|nr:site-specific integrase [Taibaiella sp.]